MKTPLGLLALITSFVVVACTSTTPPPITHAYIPAKGSSERTAIIAGTKEALAKQDLKNLVLQIPYLKINSGWAWIHVNPQSAEGKQHYESQSGLLQEKAKKWTLLEWIACRRRNGHQSIFRESLEKVSTSAC